VEYVRVHTLWTIPLATIFCHTECGLDTHTLGSLSHASSFFVGNDGTLYTSLVAVHPLLVSSSTHDPTPHPHVATNYYVLTLKLPPH